MTEFLKREFEARDATANTELREVSGIGVPYGEVAQIGDLREVFEPGSVDAEGALLFWRHAEVIGKVIADEESPEGWKPRARISETSLGNDAMTLLRDGVIGSFSIGFEDIESTFDPDTNTVTRHKVKVREVSLVPIPAYAGAAITEVREAVSTTPNKETNTMETTTPDAVAEVRDAVTDLERRFDNFSVQTREEDAVDTRSAAQILKAIVSGDEATAREYDEIQARAYTGGTSVDGIQHPAWVGDLTRIVDRADRLGPLFQSKALPAKGNKIEFAELDVNTLTVGVQANEGDDLPTGNVSVKTRTADVVTVGGHTALSRQQIERTETNVLDLHLRALAIAAGKNHADRFRAFYEAQVTAQAASAIEVADAAAYEAWLAAIVDASDRYADLGLTLDALVADKATFLSLVDLKATDGRPLMTVSGTGSNVVGSLSVQGLRADLAGVPVVYAPNLGAGKSAFVNSDALAAYKSPLVSLSDENIVNLTREFSVYRYEAFAAEIPAGIVPVEFAV